MVTRNIPSTENPWRCCIDGVWYEYPSGTSQTVPDNVAALIDHINALKPETMPVPVGYIKKMFSDGEGWGEEYSYTLPAAESQKIGGVKKGVAIEDATSETIVTQFNALLDALVDSGVLAATPTV